MIRPSVLCAVLLSAPAVSLLAGVEVRRDVQVAPEVVPRAKALKDNRFFVERQPYLPCWNFMGRYLDRPLFTDVTLRRDPQGEEVAGFYREIDILRWSGMDGFGSIAYPGVYFFQLNLLSKKPAVGYRQMLVLCGLHIDPSDRNKYEQNKRLIEAAAASESAERLDGKPVVWCYGGTCRDQLKWVQALRGDPKIPPFCFVGRLPYGDDQTDDVREACLKAFDGFQVNGTSVCRNVQDEYGYLTCVRESNVRERFPVIRRMMARPECRGKILGGYVEHGYVNNLNGPLYAESGTGRLRAYLDASLLLDFDFMVGFEWNEANENTSFQPTVSSGGAVARVIGWYRAMLDRKTPKPRPGDDTSVPNLILSVRQSQRIEEAYHVELLYVPDGTDPKPFEARVVIRNAAGRTLAEGPWEKLPTARLTAFDYRMPGEAFAGEAALVPVVETRSSANGKVCTWTGFDCTRLRATSETNYLYSRQCLRELYQPKSVSFDVRPMPDGRYALSGAVDGDRVLSSLEILDGCTEVLAADRENEFDSGRFDVFRGTFVSMTSGELKGEGTFAVAGSEGWRLRSAQTAWNCFRTSDRKNAATQRVNVDLTDARAVFLLAVPKGETPRAELKVDLPKLQEPFSFSLSGLLRTGRFAHTFRRQVRLELERLDALGDYPVPLGTTSAAVAGTLVSPNLLPVYQLRAITKAGRIWRSAPIVPKAPGGKVREIDVYSEFAHTFVTARPFAEQVPDLDYDFSDRRFGDWVPVKHGDRAFDATLGGGWLYGQPMNPWRPHCPPAFSNSVPARVKADGTDALAFDGSGQYLLLPQEAVPCNIPFTLDFECRPDDVADRVLLRMSHSFSAETSLRLITENGALKLSYFGRAYRPVHFETGLRPRPGEWNRIRIVKGPTFLRCSLNGETQEKGYNCRGSHFQYCLFGSNVMPGEALPEKIEPFKGLLRSLRIRHGR